MNDMISEKLAYLAQTKDLIRDAIEDKGVLIPEGTAFRDYPELIRKISDPDAVVGYSYGGIVGAAIPALPENYPYVAVQVINRGLRATAMGVPMTTKNGGSSLANASNTLDTTKFLTRTCLLRENDAVTHAQVWGDATAVNAALGKIVWANYDVKYLDGSLFMAACEPPAPVYG